MRLIDAYTLAEEIESLEITVAGKPARWNDAKHSVLRVIAEQKGIEAAPGVRCKECRHWQRNMHINTEHGLCSELAFIRITMHENDFCSKGEPKDDG